MPLLPEYPPYAITRWLRFEFRVRFLLCMALGAAIVIRFGYL